METSDFGMFTNEGNIALAEKLNETLDSMGTGLTADEYYARFRDLCEGDSDFCEVHGEWSDTVVREIVYSWLEAPTKLTTTRATATVLFEGSVRISVPTLDGDAQAVLEANHDEIASLLAEAIESALDKISRQVNGDIGEWSGVETRVI